MAEEFENFWSIYPRKVSKKDAQTAWNKLAPSDKAVVVETLPRHVKVWAAEGRGKEFIPHASTWLNGERWTDELEMPAPPQQAVAWWASEAGILAKGRELGIHARGGESMNEFKARVVEAARKAA